MREIGGRRFLTVGDLVAALAAEPQDALVSLEGCDCYEYAGAVEAAHTEQVPSDLEQGVWVPVQAVTLARAE